MCSCGSDNGKQQSNSSNSTSSSNVKYSADNFEQTDVVEMDVKDYGKITVGLDAKPTDGNGTITKDKQPVINSIVLK